MPTTPEATIRLIQEFFDAGYYRARYADVAAAKVDPLGHFLHHGLHERRDPNPFFDGAWYIEHYPDVAVSGMNPLLHYLEFGARELRNPHPRFDAGWYADQHPEAATNPALYHLRTGAARGFPTERTIDIRDYLPARPARRKAPAGLVVDVVIPVHKGFEETRRCIDSVLASTGDPLGRVIVVEDASPEPALVAWLRRLARQGRIRLLRNPRNLGFVRSVNAGMRAAAPNDVVLLNSDTEVPPGWLPRLAAQAYAAPGIASVSPFSNNATICSWPHDDGGPIPFGQDVAAMDAICRQVNAGRFVDVPTTVGYCMYIRRAALDQVGLFDAARFTVGYGEENDFCLRASAAGWSHRLACDVFVYHKGSVSFGPRAQRLAARAAKLIAGKYPDYAHQVAHHVALGKATPPRFAVTAALFRQSGSPVILMVSHDMGGGVRRHIDDLVKRLGEQARFLLLTATDRGGELSVLSLPGHPTLSLPADGLDDLARLLQSMGVSRVHVHHLLGMDLDLRRLIHRLGVPFDVTVHDYLAICPQINMVPWRDSLYCGEPDMAGCNACIAHRSSHGARDIVSWRMERAWQYRDADRVLCPSQDALDRLRRFGLAENALLAPHEPAPPGAWPIRVPDMRDGRLRIAVLGTLVDHKGGRSVAAVAELFDPRRNELHLIGGIEGEFPAAARKRMRVTGRYRDEDLPRLIRGIDPHVIWFPQTWPETWSYTLSAAIEAGAAIAACDIGAFPERLAGRPLTWIAPVDTDPAGWLALFETIRTHLADPPPPVQRAAVADFYAERYLQPEARRPRASRGDVAGLRQSQPVRDQEAGRHETRVLRHRAGRRHEAHAPRAADPPRRMRIAVVPERFDIGSPTPCAYIRLLQPLSHPMVADGFDVVMADQDSALECRADIIITQRFAVTGIQAAERLAAHARAIGAALVYDLDDDLLNVPRNHADAKELRPLAKVARRMLTLADAVWVSTPALARRVAPLRPDAEVIENRLDERIWTYAPASPHVRQTPVRILAMGTTTHDRDYALIEPAFLRLKAEYGNRVSIDILGMTKRPELPPGLNRIGPPMHAARSYPGFVHWLTNMQPSWHIGVAPLLDGPFNACKSAIKAMDYAALGAVVLASDVDVYRGSIADGRAGALVPNAEHDWYAALDRMVRDVDRRNAIAGRLRDTFLAEASLAAQAPARRAALLAALHASQPSAASAA